MKNYFVLYRVISVESGVVKAVYFDGAPLNIEFSPTITSKVVMQIRYPGDTIHALRVTHGYGETPDEQPTFRQQLAQAGWPATPEQLTAWNQKAEEFFQNSLPSDAESAVVRKRCTCDYQSCPHISGQCKFSATHFDLWMDCVTDNLCDSCMQMYCRRLLSNASALKRCGVGFSKYPN